MANNYNKDFDLAPYNLFVLPSICRQLEEAGVTHQLITWWKSNDITTSLETFFWDQDNYYMNDDKAIDLASNATKTPAYSIMDIEQLMPKDYSISKTQTHYELMVSNVWPVEMVVAERMADCFALMLLQLIIKRLVSVEEINKKIASSLPKAAG